MKKTLRSRIRAGETLLGCFMSWPSGGLAELLSIAGFDFIVIDTEHGSFSAESVASMVIAADAAGLPAIVRVPSSPSVEASRALDAGAAGTLFPRADGVQAVRAAVESVKFPPEGRRGLAGVRANRYGNRPLAQFVSEANEETAVAIQIETSGALAELAPISRERGVDVLFVGPNDLTYALGAPAQYDHPNYQAALVQIAQAANSSGKAAGIMVARTEQLASLQRMGYRFFTTSERTLVLEAARTWRSSLEFRST